MGESVRLVPAKIQERGEVAWTKGEKQPSACKDVLFALLFLAQIGFVCFVAGTDKKDAYLELKNQVVETSDDEVISTDTDLDYTGVGKATGVIGILSFVLMVLMLGVMVKFANILIKLSLIFSCVMSLATAAFFFLQMNVGGAIIGLVGFAMICCYAYYVWSRIEFATANLITGFEAVKSNAGITLVAYIASVVAFAWTAVWALAFVGVYNSAPVVEGCDESQGTVCARDVNSAYLVFLLLSFYWAHQVFTNVVHVSVAGTVGTWWFVPDEASSCCSSAVTSSVFRACTYSFGSICFGSLLVAIVQTLRALVKNARNNDDANAILVCVLDCILSCIQGLIEYFNKWAFVYVGIYGYGYCEAGKNVMTLFSNRGWDVVIADDLVDRCLGFVSFLLALMIGSIGLLLESTTDWFDEFEDASQIVAFILAFFIGIVISSVSLTVVNSSVDAVIVLFAEAPAEFATNHPTLSSEMTEAYMKAYPDLM